MNKFDTYYNKILNESLRTVILNRIPGTNKIKTATGEHDITDFIFRLTELGNSQIKLWAKRRNAKKIGTQIIPAGTEYEAFGKLGPCPGDVVGISGITPQERYKNNQLITMCVKRDGKNATRSIGVPEITKFEIKGVLYILK